MSLSDAAQLENLKRENAQLTAELAAVKHQLEWFKRQLFGEKSEKRLEIDFDNGVTFSYPAEYLRVESPSAEVQGHGPGQKQTVSGRRHVGILEIEPVGNYAVRLRFDDGHSSGLYSFQELLRLGRNRDRLWRAYLEKLDAAGVKRVQ